MLMNLEDATLLVIDAQERLVQALFNKDVLPARLEWLVGAATDVGLPVVFSEQYPKGLGHTLPGILASAPLSAVVEKLHFSCVAGECLPDAAMDRSQFIVTGMETHVCVLQTVLELLALEKNVFVVTDAVGSRYEHDYATALQRMSAAGAILVTREMVIFEMLRQAGTEVFKAVSKRYFTGEQPA